MQLGLQLERLTQPEVVDADLAGFVRPPVARGPGARRRAMELRHHAKRMADVAAGMRAAKALAARERLSAAELDAHRRARLNDLVRHASRALAVLARAPARATGSDGSVDLSAVPPLVKAELMERWDDVVTDRRLKRDDLLEHLERLDRDALWLGEYRAMATSGSSGLKGLFVYDREAWRSRSGEVLPLQRHGRPQAAAATADADRGHRWCKADAHDAADRCQRQRRRQPRAAASRHRAASGAGRAAQRASSPTS